MLKFLLLLPKLLCESFSIKPGQIMNFFTTVEKKDESMIMTVNSESDLSDVFFTVSHMKRQIIPQKSLPKTFNETFKYKGIYAVRIINHNPNNSIYVHVRIEKNRDDSLTKDNERVFYDIQKIIASLKDDFYETLKIKQRRNEIIKTAEGWKYKIWTILLLCPLYILVSYFSYIKMRGFFSSKKSGI